MGVLSVTAALAFGAATRPDDGAKHLVARWDFERGTSRVVVDASGNGHDGQLRLGEGRAPAARVPGEREPSGSRPYGMVGAGLRLRAADGTDVLVKDHPRLNPTGGLTVAAWIRHDGPVGPAAEIVGKKGLAKYIVDGYRLCVTRAGRLSLSIGDGTAVHAVSTPNRTIRPGVWYHVAGTFSPGRLRLYINSRLVAEATVAAQRIKPSTNPLVVGNFAGRRNAFPFNGIIDEVNLYSIALDADAIFKLAKPGQLRH